MPVTTIRTAVGRFLPRALVARTWPSGQERAGRCRLSLRHRSRLTVTHRVPAAPVGVPLGLVRGPFEEACDVDAEHQGDIPESFVGDAALSPLDADEHVTAQACLQRYRLLRQVLCQPQLPDPGPYLLATGGPQGSLGWVGLVGSCRHQPMPRWKVIVVCSTSATCMLDERLTRL